MLVLWWFTPLIHMLETGWSGIKVPSSYIRSPKLDPVSKMCREHVISFHIILAQGPRSWSNFCVGAAESSTPLLYNKKETFLCLSGSPGETHPDWSQTPRNKISHSPTSACLVARTPGLMSLLPAYSFYTGNPASDQKHCFVFIISFFMFTFCLWWVIRVSHLQ